MAGRSQLRKMWLHLSDWLQSNLELAQRLHKN